MKKAAVKKTKKEVVKKAAPKRKGPAGKDAETFRSERDLFKKMYLSQQRATEVAEDQARRYHDALSRGSRGLLDHNEAMKTEVSELRSENGRLRASIRYFDENVHQIRQRIFDYLDIEDGLGKGPKGMKKSDYEELRPKREALRAWLKAQWELDSK